MASRYEIRWIGDELTLVRLPDGPPPVRARGFLRHTPKTRPLDDLIVEVRNGEVLAYVRERPSRFVRKEK